LLKERCKVLKRLERNYRQYLIELNNDSNKDKDFKALITAFKPVLATSLKSTLKSTAYLTTCRSIDKQLKTEITTSFADKATEYALTGTSIASATYLLDS